MAVRLALNLRDELIEQYFKIGYNHAEILSCLRSPQQDCLDIHQKVWDGKKQLTRRLKTRPCRLKSRYITCPFPYSRVAEGNWNGNPIQDSRWRTETSSLNISLIWDINKRKFFHVFCWYTTRTWVLGSWGEFILARRGLTTEGAICRLQV